MSETTPILPISAFDCLFHYQGDSALPRYAGSAWRGAFGRALKKAVCVARDTPCPECLLFRTCVYPYVFETPPPPESRKMRLYTAAPHPFVLRIDSRQTASPYHLGLILFGRADRHLPYFVHALSEAGRAGLGQHRQVFELTEMRQADPAGAGAWQTIYAPGQPLRVMPAASLQAPPPPEAVQVRLETPLRLQRQGHLVTPASFHFSDLLGILLRRISMLTYFHTENPLETDFAALLQASRTVPVHRPRLSWYDWTRYSSRQNTTLDMGGLLGEFVVRADDLGPLWPYLWLGQWTHAGKGATMGLGEYSLRPASLPEAS